MKKRYVIIGLLASWLSASGQKTDSSYVRKKISQTDVSLLFSYYTQENNHSAVTGGTGTEDLQVYATQLTIDFRRDSIARYHIDAGVDVISSASTDNIDFVVSSASILDARTHLQIGYDRAIRKTGFTVGGSSGLSIESDYFSFGSELSVSHVNSSQTREWSLALQLFLDDLRWGRLNNGKPQKLIYPQELRYKEWFDEYRRNSFNVVAGIYQTINKRLALGIYPGISYQDGLLSTPFHRVYFTDESERVENFPGKRWKVPVGFQLNIFLGTRYILRTMYRFYWDDFGINAHTFNLEAPVKIKSSLTISPFIRLYIQDGADFFKPYGKHSITQEFYTSDYDLSNFESYKTGAGLRYAPFSGNKHTTFKAVELRYAFYKRSDGLTAHMITSYFDISFDRQ